LLARDILLRRGMDYSETAQIMAAIGNHDENSGNPVSDVSAALILADKADVHKSRVRNPEFIKFDIHDRVNYAVKHSALTVRGEARSITFDPPGRTGIPARRIDPFLSPSGQTHWTAG